MATEPAADATGPATGGGAARPAPGPAGSARPRLAAHVRLQWDRARSQHVLLLPETVMALNATGADILGLCDGRRTVDDIVLELQQRYGRPPADVHDQVAVFLGRLAHRRCVEMTDG